MSDELPLGWASVALSKLTKPTRPRREPQEYAHLPFVGMEQVEPHTRRLLGTVPSHEMKSTAFHFQVGDVLYGRLRPYLNKVLLADFEGLCSSEFIVLPPTDSFDPRYLASYLNNNEFVTFANQLNQGDRPRVSFEQIATHEIPLPPVAEQRRIVAKLEKVSDHVDACKQRLAKIPSLLKRFRQSVLAAACSGRLTADWRVENATQKHSYATRNILRGTKISKDENLRNTPESWIWASLDRVCSKITDGEHLTPPVSEHGVPLLSAKDVRDDHLDFSDTKFVGEEFAQKSRARCDPDEGDILVVSRGATVGRTCRVQTTAVFCLMGSVLLFKPDRRYVLPQMIEFCFKSPLGLADLISRSGSTAQQAIYIKDMREFALTVPPMPEQREIVRRVERLFALADRFETRFTGAQKQVNGIKQAILAKAFRGELVPTEFELAKAEGRPFESAQNLLARIRAATADRSGNGTTSVPGKRKGK